MVCAVTLIGAPVRSAVSASLIELAIKEVESSVGTAVERNWLHKDEAVQLIFPQSTYKRAQEVVGAIAAQFNLDHCVSFNRPKPPKLFLADMEATLIHQEMVDVLAAKLGFGTEIAKITQSAMEGNLEFAQSLRMRTAYFEGTNIDVLREMRCDITYTPGAKTLVQTLSGLGVECVLVSGGYNIFAEHVAEQCGFDFYFCNHPEVKNGALTGKLLGPVFDAHAKQAVLESRCVKLQSTREQTCAIGDGANDINMLKASGLSASYRGKPIVAEIVDLSIVHGDLTAMLFALGIKRQHFVINKR